MKVKKVMQVLSKSKIGFAMAAVLAAVSLFTTVNAGASECYYSNDLGLSLSYEEYAYLSQFMDGKDLDLFTQEEANYLIGHIAEDGVETETKYIKTEVSADDGTVLSEIYMSEEEMLGELNGTSAAITDNDGFTVSTYAYDPARRYAEIITDTRKLVLNMYSVAASAKKVSLTCTWLSIPQCKSYDVMGIRVPGYYSDLTIDINGTDNVVGYQYYDGQKIKYNHSSKNIKKSERGIGVSMNIVDSVSKSLSMNFSVNIATEKETCAVSGSYQHAQKDLSLSKSQRYTIGPRGMGGVFVFNSSVESYYDDAPGLMVVGSIEV